jgi:hypothetical protein
MAKPPAGQSRTGFMDFLGYARDGRRIPQKGAMLHQFSNLSPRLLQPLVKSPALRFFSAGYPGPEKSCMKSKEASFLKGRERNELMRDIASRLKWGDLIEMAKIRIQRGR